jgi:hypothetical protein
MQQLLIVDAILLLTRDVSPLVDESPDKGRIAIGVLEIAADYAQRLEQRLTIASERMRGLSLCPPGYGERALLLRCATCPQKPAAS